MERGNKKQSLLIVTMALAGGFVVNVGLAGAQEQSSRNASRAELIAQKLMPQSAQNAPKKGTNTLVKRLVVSADGVGQQSILVNSRRSLDLSVLFEEASDKLTDKGRTLLDDLAQALNSNGLEEASYLIGGHTDAKGDDAANKNLSERRARSVKAYLVNHLGVDGDRLAIAGFGEQRLADRDNPNSQINRRIEVSLISTGYTIKGKHTRKQLVAQIARHRTTSGEKQRKLKAASPRFASIGRRIAKRTTALRLQSDYRPIEFGTQPVFYQVDRQFDDYNFDITNPPTIDGRYGNGGTYNAICNSYEGALTDPRPEHMELDDYDARTPAECPTANEYRSTDNSGTNDNPFSGYSPEGDEELLK